VVVELAVMEEEGEVQGALWFFAPSEEKGTVVSKTPSCLDLHQQVARLTRRRCWWWRPTASRRGWSARRPAGESLPQLIHVLRTMVAEGENGTKPAWACHQEQRIGRRQSGLRTHSLGFVLEIQRGLPAASSSVVAS
jgi:hypothetical protein